MSIKYSCLPNIGWNNQLYATWSYTLHIQTRESNLQGTCIQQRILKWVQVLNPPQDPRGFPAVTIENQYRCTVFSYFYPRSAPKVTFGLLDVSCTAWPMGRHHSKASPIRLASCTPLLTPHLKLNFPTFQRRICWMYWRWDLWMRHCHYSISVDEASLL